MIPVGAPVEGCYFLNRVKEIEKVLDALEHDSILLVAPRRYGKTSLMKKVMSEVENNGNIGIYLEVEYLDSPHEFIKLLVDEFINKISDKSVKNNLMIKISKMIGAIKGNIEEVGVWEFKLKLKENLLDNWAEKGNIILERFIEEFDKNIYIFVDEVPDFIKNIQKCKGDKEALKFLKWLRSVRQKYNKIKFVFTGSISFDKIVDSLGESSSINDLRRIKIDGFTKKDAKELIKLHFNEKGFYNDYIAENILKCVGEPYIPYFISLMVNIIDEVIDKELNPDDVENLYNSKVLGSRGREYFKHYKERLKIYGEEYYPIAKEILENVAKYDKYPIDIAYGIFRERFGEDEDKFWSLICELENDFYIETRDEDGRKYLRFYSKMLKDWWCLYG
jgi:hypothetical protein